MLRLLLLVLLALPMVAQAAYTAAWKVPLETLAPDQARKDKIRKLEKPPGESAFFAPGDELWDVSGVLRDRSLLHYGYFEASNLDEEKDDKGPWKGEWAVWNARSGRLVARGTSRDILTAQLAWKFEPQQESTKVLCHFDWMRPGAEQPFQSIAITCGSGEITHKEEGGISVDVDPSLSFTRDKENHLRLVASWKEQDDKPAWEVSTSVVVRDGKRVLVAKHGNGETGWELHVSCREAGLDGTESSLIETRDHGVQRWSVGYPLFPVPSKVTLEGNQAIVWYQCPPTFGSPPFPLRPADLETPEHLREWIDSPLWDLADILREQGIAIEPQDLAAIDILANQVIVVANEQTQAAVAKLVDSMSARPDIPLFIETNADAGNNGLLVRAGERASISQAGADGESEAVFEVETADLVGWIGLELEMKIPGKDGKENGSLQTHVELMPDEWLKVGEMKSGASDPIEVSVRVGKSNP